KSLPAIVSSVLPSPNANGWNNTDLTVSFNCSDQTSGIASCSGPVTVSGEGADQAVTGSAVDKAGNISSVTVKANVDKSLPAIVSSVAPLPNANGWNNSDVTVSFNCSDALSGVSTCASPVQVTTEGAARTVTGAVVDKAGNSKSVTTTTNLDNTPPTLTIATTPPTVSSSQLILTGTVSDTLSGVSRVACNGIAATVSGNGFTCALSLAEGSNSIDVSATDFAGNVSNSLISISLAS